MSEETQALTMRLPKDLYEQLRREAFDERTSQNAIVVEALTAHFARRAARGLVVHHIDGDPSNNDPANLQIIDPRDNVR